MNNSSPSYSHYILSRNPDIWDSANKRLKNIPVFEGSHRGYAANEVGVIGEIIAEDWFKRTGIIFDDHRDKTTHDYLISDRYTLDVKTKDRTCMPKLSFDNSVPLYNHSHQRPDYYMFISLLRDTSYDPADIERFREAFIVGVIDFEGLEKHGVMWRAGDIDSTNGTKFWTDCINVRMDVLTPLRDIIQVWKS